MLTQASASDTPRRNSRTAKRHIQLTVKEQSHERSSKKRREDLVDSAVEALTVDHALSAVLNVAVYEHSSDDLEATPEGQVVVLTPNYHEPAGYTSHVRMTLTSTDSYCIQVN